MAISKNRIDKFMLEAGLMIQNAFSDPVIKTAISGFGYHEEKFMAGKKLYDEAMDLQNLQKMKYGERVAATAGFYSAWKTMNKQYMKALKIARIVFKDDAKADKALMLQGERKQSFSGWLEQAQIFYENLLNNTDLLSPFSEYGYSAESLRQEYEFLKQVAGKNAIQKKLMGEARETAELRDKKLNELAGWIADLRVVAKVALEDDPQQLEKLGIVVKRKR
jgi:hypothetical protein